MCPVGELYLFSLFKEVNGQMGFRIALSMSAAFFSPTIAWIALPAVCLLAFVKGKAYRRIVESYLYPNKNSKALFIAVATLAAFIPGMHTLLKPS
ncbi:MAG: hypothetical protein H7A01_12160 [Hahellaceae bacterium]|nr:hypothetical protein [Hahellaceae bacterium]MCP5209927.1 hypothetical protein [Hahellaceae bacterium]